MESRAEAIMFRGKAGLALTSPSLLYLFIYLFILEKVEPSSGQWGYFCFFLPFFHFFFNAIQNKQFKDGPRLAAAFLTFLSPTLSSFLPFLLVAPPPTCLRYRHSVVGLKEGTHA